MSRLLMIGCASSSPLKCLISQTPVIILRGIKRSSSVGMSSSGGEQVTGAIAAKSPTKVTLEEGKKYAWCACGLSKKQPFCDGSHKQSTLGLTPFRWTAEVKKEVFLCNCKQTKNRPFCDGTHKKL